MTLTPFVPSTGVEKQFAWLSQFPHGSKNEKALSDAICGVCRAAGLEVYQDALGNVLVRKDAAPGCEGRESVILQAHLDMVCTKVPGCEHDFLTDGIRLVVDEEGWLRADGTSLGADDGYGVAYMLELLLTDGVKHPPIECLFTVQEEIGLIGAAEFDTAQICSRRMIAMDSGGETVATVSTCGGRRITFTLPMKKTEAQGKAFLLKIGGLTGGHSAGEIHRGRANAIKLLGHTLMKLENTGAVLVSAEGGEAPNAIPRDASALLRVPETDMLQVAATFAELQDRFMKLYHDTDPGLKMTMQEAEDPGAAGYSLSCARLLVALPDGIRAMEHGRPNVVALSDNVGTLATANGELKVRVMLRSANAEWREILSEQILSTGEAFGAVAETDSDYPGMEYDPDSKIRAAFAEVVREEFGCELREESTHGGMEIGYFSKSVPGIEIVTLGPLSEGCHSPSEKMQLASFNRMYGVLVKLLERL